LNTQDTESTKTTSAEGIETVAEGKSVDELPAVPKEKGRPGRLEALFSRASAALQRVNTSARRARRSLSHRSRSPDGPFILATLIRVLAEFSKADSTVIEEEIDSSLGFLRYDYPEALYSELRRQFQQALQEQNDLATLARTLAQRLSQDRKLLLVVEIYDLIDRAGGGSARMQQYYAFMEQLGMAAAAIEVVRLLREESAAEQDSAFFRRGESPLELVSYGSDAGADVFMEGIPSGERLFGFRFHELILIKNRTSTAVTVRGRPVKSGGFCRVYSGQRVVLGDSVLTHHDLVAYFNAKKNVALAHVFLAINANEEVEISRTRTWESCLEIEFGLKVKVKALRQIHASLNGKRLVMDRTYFATLQDSITFRGDAELPFADLRRKARALGGRFHLKAGKDRYKVSNLPGELEADDILLSPGTSGDVILEIECDYENRKGRLHVLRTSRPITVGSGSVAARGTLELRDGDVIRIDSNQSLRCDFTERIIEEERNIIASLEVRDLTCHFGKRRTGNPALDGVSFTVSRGEMICVMGASGSGKSTLLRAISGQLKPTVGEILLNGQSLPSNIDALKRFIAHVPQSDAFDENLTVEENLETAAAIRSPNLSRRERRRRVDSRLVELGLSERRDILVGPPEAKTLSGGERKRLNIGLDMISSADVFLFDEPTSGLSSKDSEHVIEILRGLAHNKIVLVVIHQPTARLFQQFSRALLLDRGGKVAFFGTPNECLGYFAEAAREQNMEVLADRDFDELSKRPEFIFDVLEEPLRDSAGEVIFEEGERGQLIASRKYSPDFWRDRYERHRILQEMKQVSMKKAAATPDTAGSPAAPPTTSKVPRGRPIRWREGWLEFRTLLKRAFLSKVRNKASLLITLIAPPVLAAVIGSALYFNEDKPRPYSFATAFHIPTYIFIALLVALFLALMNSVEDIIRDRIVLQRERNLDVRITSYISAKFLTLCVFSALQCALFVLVGNSILKVRGMFEHYFFWTFVTAVSGISLGLLVSSLVPNSKTGALIVPLILIPQLIFSGSLIKYEEMNKDMNLVYQMKRWLASKDPSADIEADKQLQVPLISRLVATHYSYEALVCAQAKLNPLARRQGALQDQIDQIMLRRPLNMDDSNRLEDLKETLAGLSSLETGSARDLDRRLRYVDDVVRGQRYNPRAFKSRKSGVSTDQMYTNQKIADVVTKAEVEQSDYRRSYRVNVFFSPEKHHFYEMLGDRGIGWTGSVWFRNGFILIAISLVQLALLRSILKRQLSS
jgi:ABC-type multidrug transport system ATPase subunit